MTVCGTRVPRGTSAPRLRRHVPRIAGILVVATALSGCLGYDGSVQRGYVVDSRTLATITPGVAAEKRGVDGIPE